MSFDAVRAILKDREEADNKFRTDVGQMVGGIRDDAKEILALAGKGDPDLALKLAVAKAEDIISRLDFYDNGFY